METKTIKTSGALVLWDIDGADHSLSTVQQAWDWVGLAHRAPRPRSPAVALRVAVHNRAVAGAPRGSRRIEQAAEGLVVTETEPGARTVTHRHVLFATIDSTGAAVATDAGPDVDGDLTRRFVVALGQIDGRAISAALTETARALGAVALRPDGGVYWLPDAALATWRALVAGVESATNGAGRCYVVVTQGDADTVRCVADSFTREAEAALADVRAELEGGEIGTRAAQARARRLLSLAETAETYEAALGSSLAAIRARLEALSAEAAMAALTVDAAA